MNEESVCIYGAGGHATVVAETLMANRRPVAAYYDDDTLLVARSDGKYLPGLRLSGPANFAIPKEPFVLAIGNNRLRAEIADKLAARYSNAIHPSAVVSDSTTIGDGSVVFALSVLQPNVVVGLHVIINTASSIDHECEIGDFAHISPNATLCGNVRIGEGTHVGAGATIIEGIRIGRWSTIGAGAVVIRDVPDFTTVVGCPAHVIAVSKEPKPMNDISFDQTLGHIINEIRKVAGRVEISPLKPDHSLQHDLELDSLELAEMTVLIESKFGVDVFEDGVVVTVQDVLDRIQNRQI